MTGAAEPLGRCVHRDTRHTGTPPNTRIRSTRCTADATWIHHGAPLCDTHARSRFNRHPDPRHVPTDRHPDTYTPNGVEPTDWRCPQWAVDRLQQTVDRLAARTTTTPTLDQPALWEETA